MNNQPELTPTGPEDVDNLINNSSSRSTKFDDWWVITGTHVRLPEDMPARRPVGTNHLLVCADTISFGVSGATQIVLTHWTNVIVMGKDFKRYNGCNFLREKAVDDESKESFSLAFFSETLEHVPPSDRRMVVEFPLEISWRLRYDDRPRVSYVEAVIGREHHGSRGYVHFPHFPIPMPDAPNSLLARFLLTAQYLIDQRQADQTDDASRFLDLLDAILALDNGHSQWQELATQVAATREVIQPQLPGSNLVPELSPGVYSGVAQSYEPALRAFSDRFQIFVDHTEDIQLRRQAAERILSKEADIIRFQKLVSDQLNQNYNEANENVSRAERSMVSQSKRVEEAESRFQAGLRAWQRQQERAAQMAIAGAAFSFVSGIAKIFSGFPTGPTEVAQGITTLKAYVKDAYNEMKEIARIVQLVARIVQEYRKIVASINSISNAKEFADHLSTVRRDAELNLGDAPSASAYWDKLRVELRTSLNSAIEAGVDGAGDYWKELEVMIIFGRALTSAQATLPPIAQEMAQAALLTELARQQHDGVAREIEALKAGQAASAITAVALWLDHRSVQRTMLNALQDFDAAHHYWALEVTDPKRDQRRNPRRSFTEVAGDLLAVADIQLRSQQAFESFRPRPQNFDHEDFTVPGPAVADFLRDGRFAVRLMPDLGPFAEQGNVGRVRVREIFAWIEWNKGKRPERGLMQFTIRTNGEYYDQRVVSRALHTFRFTMNPVNFTFRYNLADDFIRVRARIADNFRDFYPDPTLFTEWQFSLPGYGGAEVLQDDDDSGDIEALNRIGLEDLQGAVSGIRLEFSGEFIKDPVQF